ncbi:unnamed protein product [Rotaria sordida]|uniref:Reverse transcriptase domain-containing protein n=1 Tax=Rotaria sordida TaxID=392033 RepID=A0A815KMB5_9BILA|nr:unnamed protein product [Rotaria sordida]CAF1394979.1 unnamed protein product [Rotaria sordida]
MSMNQIKTSIATTITSRTPRQDAQGCWYELLSPTQVFTEQSNMNMGTNLHQQQTKKKKKKSHGNRKEQHQRRKMRRQQQQQKQMNNDSNYMNDDDVMIIDDDGDVNEGNNGLKYDQVRTYSLQHHQETKLENERKRQALTPIDINVTRSFSQLSVSQETKQKKKKTTSNIREEKTNGEMNSSTDTNNIQRLKPKYLHVSDQRFKQMLCDATQNSVLIMAWLNTNEKVHSIRQMTEATNQLQYLDLQRQLWQEHLNLGMKDGKWNVHVSKSYAKQHSTCRSYSFPRHTIEQRLQTIQSQIRCTIQQLQQHLIQLQQYAQEWQPTIDVNLLSNAVNECIHLAKQIWQTTANELKTKETEELLRKRIYLQRLPSEIDTIINKSMKDLQVLLENPALNKDRRASLISDSSKTITQYKFDLMTINLDTLQNIRHGHQQVLVDLHTKLSRSIWSDLLKRAIENRQQAIVLGCQQSFGVFFKNFIFVFSLQKGKYAFSTLEQTLRDLYSKPLSRKLLRRAQYEYKTIRSIQRLMSKRPDIVIRRTDKSKVFYIGKLDDFERKAQEYMLKTQAYEEITDGRCPLADNLRAVQTLLDYLVSKNGLTKKQCNYLLPKLGNLELGHYHGLPKPHKVARETTFINSIDVVRKLETYVADGRLTSTTRFITADVTDLYTMIPRQGALDALARFCLKHSKQGKIGTLAIDHIMKMARLILDTNNFVYNNKYYRQIRGGAMGSAFTQVLANIYMLEWERDLIQYQMARHEIYGRYIDDIFMSTNETMDDIKTVLERAATKDVNIKINYQIDTSVDFLDVSIMNEVGRLRTTIYHKPAAEPYILPYKSDHPRHSHRNIPYGALLRG